MTTAAIMQPTYLPWIGYFAMMDRCDVFIFLDSVQFERRSWQQRNRIKGANGPHFLTVPVLSKGHRDQLIADVAIDQTAGFADKHIRALQAGYGKAPYFDRYANPLFDTLRNGYTKLCDLNIDIIAWVASALGLNTRTCRSSGLTGLGNKAELLASLCSDVNADVYLSAEGSKDYIERSDAFANRRIEVGYNEFIQPAYPQLHGDFVSHLSVIDLLFNKGPESLDVIRSGYPTVD